MKTKGVSWTHFGQPLSTDRGYRMTVTSDDGDLLHGRAIELLRVDPRFRTWFNSLLADSPYSAFRWETPPLTRETANRPFEFVVLDSPRLARRPDERSFAEHFQSAENRSVVVFPNLGRDGLLVVPCPLGPSENYVQIGDFVRKAPLEQIDELWRLVGESLHKRLKERGDSHRPLWLSTAGGGVAWLHVRIDDHPKYYHYEQYRNPMGDTLRWR